MTVSGIVKSSLIDYPSLVSCVLFVPNCNYDCFFCHNRGLIDGTRCVFSDRYIDEFLNKRADLLDAIVISGGEPTIQQGLLAFIEKTKRMGFKVKLDTNGSSPETVQKLLENGLCDYFAVDYKAPAVRYKEICGETADPVQVLKTIDLLQKSGINFEVRTTVIPQLGISDLVAMACELPKVPRYVLNRYRIPEKYKPEDALKITQKLYSNEQLSAFAREMSALQPNVVFNG